MLSYFDPEPPHVMGMPLGETWKLQVAGWFRGFTPEQ